MNYAWPAAAEEDCCFVLETGAMLHILG